MLKPALAATASLTILVPSPNLSTSNTPTGPFHKMVLAFLIASASFAALLGLMSRIISSSAMVLTDLVTASADSSEPKKSSKSICDFLATTTSSGSNTWVSCIMLFAVSTMSASYSDAPTLAPLAAKNVLAIPPPTMIWSQIFANDLSTSNFVETFEPPTIASMGLAGLSKALANASSSAANNGPAQAVFALAITPSVDASAR